MLPALFLAAFAGVGSALTLKTSGGAAKVYTSCLTPNTAALTFDDGPYQWSKDVTDLVTAAGGHCTFFVNGNNWDCIYGEAQRESLAYAFKAGHQIANHGWAHQDLTTLNTTQMDSEIKKVDDALRDILGVTPAYLRPPYGNYNDDVRAVAANHSKSLVIWDFDSGDFDEYIANPTPRHGKSDTSAQTGLASQQTRHNFRKPDTHSRLISRAFARINGLAPRQIFTYLFLPSHRHPPDRSRLPASFPRQNVPQCPQIAPLTSSNILQRPKHTLAKSVREKTVGSGGGAPEEGLRRWDTSFKHSGVAEHVV
ncbi:hypothetical protein C8F04DRAFT_1394063 [Mycena alexandri]|uniref:NodB homology domain-containing protein n=1 Tax=Mycena alexandri TaxID=1745969 RepID=A0AAD6X6J9_9AGAR|nr:hypothetical protein C8F04DRAFT_1394063 [Mycena alexandri]